MNEVIHSDNAPAALGPYSQVIKAGNTIFCSGQIPINPATNAIEAVTIEDSAAFGFTPGIVKLLSKKGRKSVQAQKCEAWLDGAFGKTASAVLREPSAAEIHARVWHLHELVCTALPAK